ncbi:hypothetical protein [Citrobacter freundii]|nr:hypothetical protein [Citrobacter freundii]MEB2756161.1 hypothetical protein [Citrobacter freundii]
MYELVYAQLLNIKKWADNEFRIIELHMIPRWIESSYQPYFNEEQEKQFYEEIKQAQAELERVVNDEEFQIKNADLEKKLSFAMTSLTEVLITKAIILHPNIEIILNRLIENIGSTPSPEDEEEPDDYAYRVKNAIDTALNEIKTTALSDLEIRQQKN